MSSNVKEKQKLLGVFVAGVLAATMLTTVVGAAGGFSSIPAALAQALAAPNSVNSAAIIDGEVKSADVQAGVALKGPASIDSPTFSVNPTLNRVGIGTTAPQSTLEVVSPSDRVAEFKGTGNAFLRLWATGNTDLSALLVGNGGASKWSVGTDEYLRCTSPEASSAEVIAAAPLVGLPFPPASPTPPPTCPGASDFRIANHQTDHIVMGINGNTDVLDVYGGFRCNNCIGSGDLGASAVTSTHMSESFLRFGGKTDGTHGWNPNGSTTSFVITNVLQAKQGSIVLITIEDSTPTTCAVHDASLGSFKVNCNVAPSNGSILSYLVINK